MQRTNQSLNAIRQKRKHKIKRRNIPNEKLFVFRQEGLHKLKTFIQSDTDTLSENTYPPIVEDSECHQSYADAYYQLNLKNFTNRKTCSACSLIVPSCAKPEILIDLYDPHMVPNLQRLQMNIPPNHPQIQYHANCCVYEGDSNNALSGLLLDKAGIDRSGTTVQLWICSACHYDLSGNVIPSYSLANSFYIGEVPNFLPKLTWMEEKVISRVRFNSCVLKLVESKLPSQKGFKGHLIARSH